MWIYIYAGVFLTSLLLSLLLVPLTKKLAFAFKVIDYPSSRKSHSEPVPLLGGLGIYFSVICTIIFGLLMKNFLASGYPEYYRGIVHVMPELFLFLFTLAVVIFFGVLDDLYSFRSYQKLFLQIVCGVITYSVGIRITFLPVPWADFLLTLFWIILCMNSFNLLDHMDGLSAGVGLIAGSIFFLSSAASGQFFIATLLSCFVGSVAGFLWYNFPPAKIFMGESGSSMLGYFLGVLSIMGTYYKYQPGHNFFPVFTPLIIFSLPFFDTLGVVAIRIRQKKPIFQADKNHLSHRLMRLGMSKRQAILFCYLLTIACGLGALFLRSLHVRGGILVLLQVVLILSCVAILETTGNKKI